MKTKTLSLLSIGILMILAFAISVSADLDFESDYYKETVNISQGGSYNIPLKILNNYDEGITNLSIFIVLMFDDITGYTYPLNIELLTVPSSIPANSNISLTAKISVPTNTPISLYEVIWGVQGIKEISRDVVRSEDHPFLFMINVTEAIEEPVTPNPSMTLSSSTISSGSNSATITLKNNGNVDLSGIVLTADGDFNVTLNQTSISSLSANATRSISVTADSEELEKLISGGKVTITVNASDGTSTTSTITLAANYCVYTNPGSLKINRIDLENKGVGISDIWYPLDIIEVQVEVENRGKKDVDDIILEWGLYSTRDDKWIIEPKEEDDFDLQDRESKTVNFEIELDRDLEINLDDLREGTYILYVRAYGDTEDKDKTCIVDSKKISIKIERNYLVLKDIEVIGTPNCGSEVQINADIVNLGTKDQENFVIIIWNTDLGINEEIVIESKLSPFKMRKLDFQFTLPTDLEEKKYNLNIEIRDSSDVIYKNSESKKSSYSVPVSVSGNCVRVVSAKAYASLESGGKAGEQTIILASITNTDSKTKTYTIKLADYSGWAELEDITPSTLTLAPNEVKDVVITINLNDDVSGRKELSIIVEDERGVKMVHPFVLNSLEKESSIGDFFSKNLYLIGIIILNVILILTILVVALRVSRS